jgi:protein ImuB
VLLDQDRASRRARLGEAVAQVRIVAGRDAALRAVCVDPDSRVPERRVVLAPVSE